MNREYLRGHRAEKMIDVDGDFCFDREEIGKIIKAFCAIPEQHITPKEEIYISSAWKEGEE